MDDLRERMRESVARALWRQAEYKRRALTESRGRPFIPGDEDSTWVLFASDAQAAIAAVLDEIREPDTEMVDAARVAGERCFSEGREPTARTDFTAMIDELRGRDD